MVIASFLPMANEIVSTLAFPVGHPLSCALDWGRVLAGSPSRKAARARPIALKQSATAAQAFVAIGASCLRHVVLNEQGVRIGDAEAVHQMRVGLRRLRAAMSIFKAMLRDSQSEALKVELSWLTDQLAPARDYDVFLTQRRARSSSERRDELDTALIRHRAAAFDAAALAVASDRARQLAVRMARWLSTGDWATILEPQRQACRARRARALAREAFERRMRKVQKRLEKLERLDVCQRHRLRIAVKKLSYATEFFAKLFPESIRERKKVSRVLKKLQKSLGELNDIAVQERLCANLAAAVGGTQELRAMAALALAAASALDDGRAKSLILAATKLGTRLGKLPRFWK